MIDCIFCKIISGQIQSKKILENDDIIVINDIAPKATVHLLIIPKKHIQDIQSLGEHDSKIAERIFNAAKELSKSVPNASDFKFVINSGKGAGQKVFHLHAHFLAGKIKDLDL